MVERTIEDRLREEYFDLLPDIRRVAEHLEAEVKYCLLPISRRLDKYEQIAINSRIKECESSLDALRRRQEGGTFDRDQPELYTLTSLNDLAGVRVLSFPKNLLTEIDREMHRKLASWKSDPVPAYDDTDETLAFKYCGYCEASNRVRGEIQIVPMLIGLFWEVEHSAIYKPTPRLKGVARSLEMQQCGQDVVKALITFEKEFETLIRRDAMRTETE
jgi:ppGpp synthetase/RelA/SpoT-type nucleotidyltranferase